MKENMKEKEKLVQQVSTCLDRIQAKLDKIDFPKHAVDIAWGEEESAQFIFPESILLPELVDKFKDFTIYPNLEENGLSEFDVDRLLELTKNIESASDDDLIHQARIHEEDIFKKAGELIANITFAELPAHILVTMEDESYTDIIAREDENGKVNFKLARTTMKLAKSRYQTKCLRKVQNEEIDENGNVKKVNIHRFFDLIPNNMLDISLDVGARFGKIGEKGMNLIDDGDFWKSPKASQLFWLLYYQKLNEGYEDMTDDLKNTNDPVEQLFREDTTPDVEDDDPAIEFYNLVIEAAKQALDEFGNDWKTNPNPYNGRMLNSCWKTYEKMSTAFNIDPEGFLDEADAAEEMIQIVNDGIKKLIAVINPPFKKGVTVDSFMVKSVETLEEAKKTITDTLTEWEGRINAMEALTATTAKQQKAAQKLSPFGTVKVSRPTDEQMEWIKDLVRKEQPKYVDLIQKAYMLDPVERRAAYEEALEKAEDKTEADLFHGTVNGNVASITSCGGPTINVAVSNGRAFGNGTYWSHDPDKSAGYSSYARYSRWANGNSNCGWLFIGRIHYGKAYNPYGAYNGQSTEEAVKNGGYDCCHARPGETCLQRDEVITYDEEHSYVEAIIMIGDQEIDE